MIRLLRAGQASALALHPIRSSACICISTMWSLLLCLKVWLANSAHECLCSKVGAQRPCAANACSATMPLAVWPVADTRRSPNSTTEEWNGAPQVGHITREGHCRAVPCRVPGHTESATQCAPAQWTRVSGFIRIALASAITRIWARLAGLLFTESTWTKLSCLTQTDMPAK